MRSADFYKDGEWNFFCDFCGRKAKSSEAMKTWDGYRVCAFHKEVRNPQDFIRGIKDDQSVPWSRPEAPDQFVPTIYTRSFSEVTTTSEVWNFNYHKVVPGYVSQATVNGWSLNGLVLNGSKLALEAVTFGQSTASVNGAVLGSLAINASGIARYPYPIDETTFTSESVVFSNGEPLADATNSSETFSRVFSASRNFSDTAITVETYSFSVMKQLSDSANTAEMFVYLDQHITSDAAITSESVSLQFQPGSVRAIDGALLNYHTLG